MISKTFIAIAVVWALFLATTATGVVFVILHFITKFW